MTSLGFKPATLRLGEWCLTRLRCRWSRWRNCYCYSSLYSPLVGLGRFLNLLILYTIGKIPWTGDQPIARSLPTRRTTQTEQTQTSMPRVGLEPTTPAFDWEKTVYALDRAVTVIREWCNWHRRITGMPLLNYELTNVLQNVVQMTLIRVLEVANGVSVDEICFPVVPVTAF
jgi:hypothetical protein